MNNTWNFPTTPANRASSDLVGHPGALSRRAFIRYLTVGATAIAVEGCGGGGGTAAANPGPSSGGQSAAVTPPAPAPTPAPGPIVVPAAPVWSDVPAITFTEGIASSISVANFVSIADTVAFTLTLNATPLPTGVTFNSATRSFDYDGRGATNSTDGHVLTAIVG